MSRLTAVLGLALAVACSTPQWDDSASAAWHGYELVEIPSRADSAVQKAYFRRATGEAPRPLVMVLHTWSGDYSQKDPLASLCAEANYHYIHPDFRGPNVRPEAGGSPLVVADLHDALDYAMTHAHVDSSQVHIVGTSGGGYATLLAYTRLQRPVTSFSAWVPLSDMVAWHEQCDTTGPKYARHIEQIVGLTNGQLDTAEAKRRSPLYDSIPSGLRSHAKLYIRAGINDGHTGSIPVSHSLNMYNHVATAFGASPDDLVSEQTVEKLLARDTGHLLAVRDSLGDRKVIFQRQHGGRVLLQLFEGGHEMVVPAALEHIGSARVLVIGDSHAEVKRGWAAQLAATDFHRRLANTGISGNTVGFDNLGSDRLNTLAQLDRHVAKAVGELGQVDVVVVLLGTNDTKEAFADRQEEAAENYAQLIDKLQQHPQLQSASLLLVSPPPVSANVDIAPAFQEKFRGARARVNSLVKRQEALAHEKGVAWLNLHDPLLEPWPQLTSDGIHCTAEGYQEMARRIDTKLSALGY